MKHLLFSPDEYRALSRIGPLIRFDRRRLHVFKRLLVESLSGACPELARRIDGMRRRELLILHDHLREQRPTERRHDLSAEEFGVLADACGPFLLQARFLEPLRAFLRQFRGSSPGLAGKLERLSHHQFEALCQEMQERAKRKA
jgi:hypothetical protein